MANLIEIIFRGKNETGEAAAQVQESLANVDASAASANDALNSISAVQVSAAMLEFKDAAVEAFQAAAAAAGEFIDAAAESELVGARMEATIRALGDQAPATADEINALADELSKLTGFDDEALVEAETTLARIGSVSEENFDRATRAAVDLAAATGMDLNTAFQQVGMAMQNADFGRLARQIGDLPPDMQEAAKAAYDMGDSLKVQEIILSGIEQKVGGVGKEIGDTFTGELNKARVAYGNFQENAGTPLLKLFTGLPQPIQDAGFAIYSFGGTIMPVIGAVANLTIAARGLQGALGAQGIAGALSSIGPAAASMGPLLVTLGAIALAVGAVVAVWYTWNKEITETNEKGAAAVKSTWDKFFADQVADGRSATEIVDAYREAQERAQQALDNANPIVKLFIKNKKDLVNGDKQLEETLRQVTGSEEEYNRAMDYAAQTTRKTAAETQRAGASFAQFGKEVEAAFWGMLKTASTAAGQIGQIVGAAFQRAWFEIKAADDAAWQSIYTTFGNIVQTITTAGGNILKTITDTWTGMETAIQRGFDKIVKTVEDRLKRIWDQFKFWAKQFVEIGSDIVEGIWNGIQGGWEWLKTQISANMNSLLQWVKDQLGIASPSKVFAEQIGLPMAQGVAAGFAGGMAQAAPSMGLALQPAAVPAPAYAGMSAGGYGAVAVNVYGELSPEAVGRMRREAEDIGYSAAAIAIKRRRR